MKQNIFDNWRKFINEARGPEDKTKKIGRLTQREREPEITVTLPEEINNTKEEKKKRKFSERKTEKEKRLNSLRALYKSDPRIKKMAEDGVVQFRDVIRAAIDKRIGENNYKFWEIIDVPENEFYEKVMIGVLKNQYVNDGKFREITEGDIKLSVSTIVGALERGTPQEVFEKELENMR